MKKIIIPIFILLVCVVLFFVLQKYIFIKSGEVPVVDSSVWKTVKTGEGLSSSRDGSIKYKYENVDGNNFNFEKGMTIFRIMTKKGVEGVETVEPSMFSGTLFDKTTTLGDLGMEILYPFEYFSDKNEDKSTFSKTNRFYSPGEYFYQIKVYNDSAVYNKYSKMKVPIDALGTPVFDMTKKVVVVGDKIEPECLENDQCTSRTCTNCSEGKKLSCYQYECIDCFSDYDCKDGFICESSRCLEPR